MNVRLTPQVISTVLVFAGLVVYMAAKIHFFKHYGETDYFREHSLYWILVASIGLLLFLIERSFPAKPPK